MDLLCERRRSCPLQWLLGCCGGWHAGEVDALQVSSLLKALGDVMRKAIAFQCFGGGTSVAPDSFIPSLVWVLLASPMPGYLLFFPFSTG